MTNAAQTKISLIARLDESHRRLHKVLSVTTYDCLIHDGWRVRDILGHIAVWELETVRSLQAYRDGSAYQSPAIIFNDFDSSEGYNEQAIAERTSWTDEQIAVEWESVREDFRAIIKAIPDALYPGDLLYPWGARGSIEQLIDEMVAHEDEHRESISQALGMEHI
jgi:hypothetical protein